MRWPRWIWAGSAAGTGADGHGRAAFDPEMMVALLLYGYWTSAFSVERVLCRMRFVVRW